ncbi:hypothetical protein PMZ80_002271 [Knufia obscura]|uniref:Ysc84 actin-binding domain-containing protein n=2 Tax=Knufia TaxID=430999 RepID=A0AAN8I510_9EURO|nr:hypothetical protein PMZ80_002271 [Knufia obscura]KAK5950630.1 hypothetical protein OHC33_008296 [Knufia fluminis]
MAQSGSSTWQAPQPTFWERTKNYSSTAYTKALKPGFDKAYAVVDKLGAPVNRLSNKVGSEAFWPTTIDKESEKCARILRTFCKDGFYDKIDEEAAKQAIEERKDTTVNVPSGTQRNVVKIPAKVIQNAVGLAIFTTMRTGWLLGGSGGAGVVVARHPETREWSPPSGIMTQNISFGFLGGVDIYDTVLVINNYRALEAFTRLRCTLGSEVGVAAGPVGIGGELDMEIHKKPAPVWSYVKSRGLYAGIALAGNAIIERNDENAKFYHYEYSAADILAGKVRHPPEREYKILTDTLKAAQGDSVDESLLPSGESPSDFEVDFTQGTFGVPAVEDDDPYGVKALEAEGLHIREAGTHQRPSAEVFDFNPAPSSPIYKNYRRSIDGASLRRKTDSWRNSTASLNSVTRATQTSDDEGPNSAANERSRQTSLRKMSPDHSSRSITASPIKEDTIDENNPIHQASLREERTAGKQKEDDSDKDDLSDLDSDVEIGTAVSTVARPRVVQVSKPVPPALPPRNPGRAPPSPQSNHFTVKLKTAQDLPQDRLILRTSLDNWTVDHKGEAKDGVFHFKLDTTQFSDDFECKFVILPNRWMHDPNLVVASPAPGEDITFTDSRVIFDPPVGEDASDLKEALEAVRLGDQKTRRGSDAEDDAFVSVPPTPDEQENKIAKPNGV